MPKAYPKGEYHGGYESTILNNALALVFVHRDCLEKTQMNTRQGEDRGKAQFTASHPCILQPIFNDVMCHMRFSKLIIGSVYPALPCTWPQYSESPHQAVTDQEVLYPS